MKKHWQLWPWVGILGVMLQGSAHAGKAAVLPATPYPVQVASCPDYVMVIDQFKTLWTWGGSLGNNDGAMGVGDDADLNFLAGNNGAGGAWHREATPVGRGYVHVSCGNGHTVAVREDGSLWAWGRGLIGNGVENEMAKHHRPVQIGEGFVNAVAGHDYTLAIKQDGSLWSWGSNTYGQLGDGSKFNRSRPVMVGSGFTQIAAGLFHSAAIKTDGSLWLWGSNRDGQIGLGVPGSAGVASEYLAPVKVGEGYGTVAVGDSYSAALKKNGDLYVWGKDNHRGLGRGPDNDESPVPVKLGEDFASLARDYAHTLALKKDGSLWEWGYRREGASLLVPTRLGEGVVSIAAGGYGSAAIKTDHSLWLWGMTNWQLLADYGYPDMFDPKRNLLNLIEPTQVAFPLVSRRQTKNK